MLWYVLISYLTMFVVMMRPLFSSFCESNIDDPDAFWICAGIVLLAPVTFPLLIVIIALHLYYKYNDKLN